MAKLISNIGGKYIEHVLENQSTIGRQPTSTIPLQDPRSSGRHALLVFDQNQWELRDLGSSNGTFVNDQRIETVILRQGDQIQFGNTVFTFSTEVGQAPSQPRVTIDSEQDAPMIHQRVDGRGHDNFLPVDEIASIDQLKQDYEKLRIASELNKAIGLEADLDILLHRILDELFKLLPADRGVILLMDQSDHQLKPRATKHRVGSEDDIILSNTVISEVFGSGAAVLTSDATLDSRFSAAKSVMAMGMRSTMCVPMIYRQQIFGIIHLDSLFARGVFSNKDLLILTGLAAQAGRAIDNSYKAKEIERSALARRDFERLLPPEIVEQVISGKVQLQRGGELRETTVLFSDIRGFTQWSEKHQPAHIVSILNDYFELMVDAIHRHHGTLDKFMGDGIMALFGAPIAHDNDPLNAVLCSLDMLNGLATLNEKLANLGQEEVAIGIGINNGPIIAGYMGSSKSMEYTAIGDHVNLAARLCGAAVPGQILLSDRTYDAVKEYVNAKPLAPIRVKGKSEPISIFQLIGEKHTDTTPSSWDQDTTSSSRLD